MSIRPGTQIYNTNVYDDQIAGVGVQATYEPAVSASDGEFDFNTVRTILNLIVSNQGGNWYDDLAGRDLNLTSADLLDLEVRPVTCNASVLTQFAVPNAQNWVILDVSLSEAPSLGGSQSDAVEGVIVATSSLSGAGFDVFELTERSSTGDGSALSPLSLVVVVGPDGQPLQSGTTDILANIQVESTFTPDGGAFNDVSAGNRVKLSFVIANAGRTDLIACPVVDIENQTISYNYLFNQLLENLDPSCFTGSRGFVDQAADVGVTLSAAITGQGAGAFIGGNSINWGFAEAEFLDLEDSLGATLMRVTSDVTGSGSEILFGADTDSFDNNAVVNDFVAGATLGSGLVSSIAVAVSTGLIEASGALTLESNGADATLLSTGGGAVFLNSAVNVNIDADTVITLNTPNAADASTKEISLTAGNSTAGTANGGPVSVTTGTGFDTGMGGIFGVTLGVGGASGDAGYMDVTHGGTDEMRVAQFSVAGVGAGLFGLFSGSSSPDGRVNADGDIGSLFVDSTNSAMWISSDGATAWTQFAVGGADSWGASLAVGNTSNGNDAIMTSLDVIHGEDAAAPGVLVLDGGDATVAATAGAGATLTGGFGNTSGDGGPGSVTGGTPGVTGNGGVGSVAGGPGGATSGDGGDATIDGGTVTEGDGGSVIATAAAGVGTDRAGGGVSLLAGGSTGTIDGALITLTPGSVTGSGARGYVTIDADNGDDEHLFELDNAGGSNGSVTQMLVGDRDPNVAVIAARPSALYFRNQLAAGSPSIWVNVSVTAGEGTSWEEIVSGVVTADTWAQVLVQGADSGGTSPVMTSGDDIIGEDSAVATATGYTLRGGDHNGAAVGPFSGGPLIAKGGDSDASANGSAGGLLTLEGGEYTGVGGGLSAGGGVAIAGGRATVGGGLADGGFVTIDGGEGFEIGGPVTITAGRGQTAAGADAALIGGRGATDGGNCNITAGITDGGNAADDGGTVNISSGGGTVAPYNTGDINILVPQIGPASNISGGSVTIEAGNTGTRNVPGGDVHTRAGDNAGGGATRGGELTWETGTQSGGAGGPGGNATLTLGGSTNSTPGVFIVTGPQDEDEELMRLTTVGSGGESMSVFVGQLDPSAGGGVSADEGSTYHRDDGAGLGEMYLKFGAGNTDWALVQTGSGDTTLSEAITLETATNFIATNGTSWGLLDTDSFALTGPAGAGDEIFQVNALAAGNTVIVDGDTTINGNDGVGGNSIQLLAGAGVAATNDGTGVRLLGGDGNTTGTGGTLSGAAGNGGANGNGGPLTWDSGNGGATAGNSGAVAISTGTVTDGDTGDITLNVANAVGVGAAGGSVVLDPGDSPDSIDGGNTVIRTGSSGSADAGFVHFDTPNRDDEHWGQVTTAGASGTVVQLLAGVQDPNTAVISALGGSLYQQRVVAASGSALWVNENVTAGEGALWGQCLTDNSRSIGQGIANTTIAANTDISDQAAASNVTMDFGTFPTIPSTQAEMDVRTAVFINGVRQRSGVTVVRTGTQATAIQLTFGLVLGDVVTVEQWTV